MQVGLWELGNQYCMWLHYRFALMDWLVTFSSTKRGAEPTTPLASWNWLHLDQRRSVYGQQEKQISLPEIELYCISYILVDAVMQESVSPPRHLIRDFMILRSATGTKRRSTLTLPVSWGAPTTLMGSRTELISSQPSWWVRGNVKKIGDGDLCGNGRRSWDSEWKAA